MITVLGTKGAAVKNSYGKWAAATCWLVFVATVAGVGGCKTTQSTSTDRVGSNVDDLRDRSRSETTVVSVPVEPKLTEVYDRRCLPLARCASFSDRTCSRVESDGTFRLPDEFQGRSPSLERACPGDQGVHESVIACFDYVEGQNSCRARPQIRIPEYQCTLAKDTCIAVPR